MEDPIGKSNQEEKQTSNDYLKIEEQLALMSININTKLDNLEKELKTEISNMKKELKEKILALKNEIKQIKKSYIKETDFKQYENVNLKKDKKK